MRQSVRVKISILFRVNRSLVSRRLLSQLERQSSGCPGSVVYQEDPARFRLGILGGDCWGGGTLVQHWQSSLTCQLSIAYGLVYSIWTQKLCLWSRGLRSRARFKPDETIQDWRAIPELAVPGKSRKNLGNKRDGTGLLTTTRESLV